ncbi:hypothetical protein [Neisseria sp. 74A18]|nr:hypothetical protein [Neisseria sp. 74A18]
MQYSIKLLRHQKALLNEARYFSAMKHQIELYSGLARSFATRSCEYG